MIDGLVIAKHFIRATLDVLETMAGLRAAAGKPFVKKTNTAKGDVSAIVGVTGAKAGTIAVSFTRSCALAMVRGMLGDDIHDILADTQDAVGEVTNMISGKARASLAAEGLALQGSTPTVIVGENHLIRHISANPVMVIPFSTDQGEFVVEFCF